LLVGGDAGQQLGQVPAPHQGLLQRVQFYAQHLALRDELRSWRSSCCSRAMRSASSGACTHSSISAKSCSSAALWMMLASGSVR
jgi:hypothetical protein